MATTLESRRPVASTPTRFKAELVLVLDGQPYHVDRLGWEHYRLTPRAGSPITLRAGTDNHVECDCNAPGGCCVHRRALHDFGLIDDWGH